MSVNLLLPLVGFVGIVSAGAYFVTAPRNSKSHPGGIPLETTASSAIQRRFQVFDAHAMDSAAQYRQREAQAAKPRQKHNFHDIAMEIRHENDDAAAGVPKRNGKERSPPRA